MSLGNLLDDEEQQFLSRLLDLGCVVWVGEQEWRDNVEFTRPTGWQKLHKIGNEARLSTFEDGKCLCLNTGGEVAVVDVDPRNGGEIEKVRALLDELKVRIFAEVDTPSGGKHFYIAGHPDLPSIHSKSNSIRLPEPPGVDIQSYGCNVFLPGTLRRKYGGDGYKIVLDELDEVTHLGDGGSKALVDWLAEQVVKGVKKKARKTPGGAREWDWEPCEPWNGTPPDARQQAYLAAVVAGEAEKVAKAGEGERNGAIFLAALKCGSYIAGAGMDEQEVRHALEKAAADCDYTAEHTEKAVRASIASGVRGGRKNPRAVPSAESSWPGAGADERHKESSMDSDGQAGQESGDKQDKSLYTDVAAMLDGTLPEPPRPCVLCRTDGQALFYKGEVNIVFGDPDHGKTWVVLAACAETLKNGGRVLSIDLDHNGAAAIVSRLLLLGAPKEALRDPDRFRHCEPGDSAGVGQVVKHCEQWQADTVVIDSTGELLPMFGASSDSADDFTQVHTRVLQPLADTGAAVLLVDHLAKGRESRAMGPGGSMAKRRTVGGSSVRVVRVRPFTRREGGKAHLLVNKDRHGGLRDRCPPPLPGKEEQLAGTFVLGAADNGGLAPWQVVAETLGRASGTEKEWRPTTLMERASCGVEEEPGVLTKNKLARKTGGKKEYALRAIEVLEREGYLTKSGDQAPLYTSVKAYRVADDPLSDEADQESRLRQHMADEPGEADEHEEDRAGE